MFGILSKAGSVVHRIFKSSFWFQGTPFPTKTQNRLFTTTILSPYEKVKRGNVWVEDC